MACIALSLFSCRRRPGEIGDNLLPEGNYLKASFVGDSSMTAYSVRWDTINTGSQSRALLGCMVDSVFGKTKAGFYTQIIPSSFNTNFGDSIQIDSVLWEMAYAGFCGDSTTLQTIHIYQITDPSFNDSATLRSTSTFTCDPVDLAGGLQFQPAPNSPYIVGSDTSNTPTLRVKLDNSLGQKILTDAWEDSTAFKSKDDFTNFFNGLYVTCDDVTADGGISYLMLVTSGTYMTVYYRNSDNPDSTLTFYYSTTAQQLRCNVFEHDYTLASSDFVNQVVNGDTTLGGQKLYLQSMGGVRTRIRLKGFEQWQDTTDKRIVINEAKLVLHTSDPSESYSPPKQLAIVALSNEEGTQTENITDVLMGTDFFGGTYSNGTVTFRITNYIQDLVQAGTNLNDNYGLYIQILGPANNAERWTFEGPESGANPMRLDIIYSLVNI